MTPHAGPSSRAPRTTRPYTIRDQVALRRLHHIAVSPDGARVAMRVESRLPGRNELDCDLWIVDADGSGLRQLTRPGGEAYDPVFAPDGRSLFYIYRYPGERRQIVRLPLDGGEPVQVTHSPVDVETFVLSPDGRSVAFSANVFPADGTGGSDTLAGTARRLESEAGRLATGRIHDRLLIRHWDEWKTGRRRHLFVQRVEGGRPIDVMPAMDADSPVKPFGGSEQYTFTPDGTGIVFTAQDTGREEAWSTDLDLFLAPVDGSAPPRKLTETNRATDRDPSFSPEGRTLAYLAMDRPGYEADKQTVILRDWPDGPERRLTDHWDRSVESLEWSPDGRTLYVVAEDVGQTGLFGIDVETGTISTVVGRGHVAHVRAVGRRLFYVKDALDAPPDLYRFEDGKERQLTRLNARAMRGVALGRSEQFSFAGWNGETVHAYLTTPPDLDPARKYPIAFVIHGGPQSSAGNDWHWRWNPQVFAGAGYAVVQVDFHGSTGYGQAFTDSIQDDWGGKPLEDLKKGYAAALERYPFLDPTRAGALGASFGGYMVNLIAGVWNEPWRCLVSHDGNLDERFAYFATEELWFPEWEHRGTPWENPEGYAKHDPIAHIASWRVPMLVIHGALDYRVSEVEGLATFTALQRRGIPSRLLYFPDENHWVLKPENSVLWHDTVLGWLDRWTADASTPDA